MKIFNINQVFKIIICRFNFNFFNLSHLYVQWNCSQWFIVSVLFQWFIVCVCRPPGQRSNFRPVSVLSTFSKIYEQAIKEQIILGTEKFLSLKISAYRKSYSTQRVITYLIEVWREKLDQNFIVGAVLTDLSKAFDCIPHDLLIAKLAAYGFDLNALALIFTYLKNRKQSVRIVGLET